MLCDVIKYNDIISASDSRESVKMYISLMYEFLKISLSNMSRLETFGMTLVHLVCTGLEYES